MEAWDAIISDSFTSILEVQTVGIKCRISQLRSLYWRIYLEYLPTLTIESWPLILQKERQGYQELKSKFIFDPSKIANEARDWTLNNPLSQDQENPWNQKFKDLELENLIRQDVERTFPEIELFRDKSVQDVLTNILFIWCKLNPDISYRQGMHELLAVLYLILQKDGNEFQNIPHTNANTAYIVFDLNYVEHDCAILFMRLMKSMRPWFEVGTDTPRSQFSVLSSQPKTMPIIASCKRIQSDYLRVVDGDLYRHLQDLGIEPQLYGIRWIRLLFAREYELSELSLLWDSIFAFDASLSLVEWICLSMLIHLRSPLLASDYSNALICLMRFPSNSKSYPISIQKIISNAIELKALYESQTKISLDSPETVGHSSPKMKRNTPPWTSSFTSPLGSSSTNVNANTNLNTAINTTLPSSSSKVAIKENENVIVSALESQVEKLQFKLKKMKQRDESLVQSLQRIYTDLQDPNGPMKQGKDDSMENKMQSILNSLLSSISTLQSEDVSVSQLPQVITPVNETNMDRKEQVLDLQLQEKTNILPLTLESPTPSSSSSSLQTAVKEGLKGFNKVLQGFFDEKNTPSHVKSCNEPSNEPSNISRRLLDQVKQHSSFPLNKRTNQKQSNVQQLQSPPTSQGEVKTVNSIYHLDPLASSTLKKSMYPPQPCKSIKEEFDPLGALESRQI